MNRPWLYMVGMMILLLVLIVVSLCMGIIPISASDFLQGRLYKVYLVTHWQILALWALYQELPRER